MYKENLNIQYLCTFRSHFGKKVIFILVSDDIEWSKTMLSKRNRIEDLYFASSPLHSTDDG